MPQPRLMRIGAGEQRRTRRAAPRIVIELREGETVFRQRIDIRRRDFAAETAHVGKADIVEQDHHDVRAGGLREGRLLRRAGGRSEEHTSELQSLTRLSYAAFCL